MLTISVNKRKLVTFLFSALLFVSWSASGQECSIRSHYFENTNKVLYGLYNNRTNYWVIKPKYEDGDFHLGSYSGIHYYRVQNNGFYGIVSDKGVEVVAPQFQDIRNYMCNGFIAVQKNGSWGVIDTHRHIIVPFSYRYINLFENGCICTPWNGDDKDIQMSVLMATRDRLIEEDRQAQNKAEQERKRKAAAEKKEKELASASYYVSQRIEPIVNKWLEKNEFEKLTDWKVRVLGPQTPRLVDSLSTNATMLYLDEYKNQHYEQESFSLGEYDSEKEEYTLNHSHLGTIHLRVPINKGKAFKDRFLSLSKKDAEYSIVNDKAHLSSLTFFDEETGESYLYKSSQSKEESYTIDPNTFHFNLINFQTGKCYSTSSIEYSTNHPNVQLLTSNSYYNGSTLSFEYKLQQKRGINYELRLWLNGQAIESPTIKCKKIRGESIYTVNIPLEDAVHYKNTVLFFVVDSSGWVSDFVSFKF
jgi:hypothetical protein